MKKLLVPDAHAFISRTFLDSALVLTNTFFLQEKSKSHYAK
jgi:hypothetical protein